jgi:hypothetical protein
MLINPFEGLTLWQDSVVFVQDSFAWSKDFLGACYDRTIMMLLEPWLWLTSFLSTLFNLFIEFVAAPFRLFFYLGSWLVALLTSWGSIFAMKIQEPIFQSADMVIKCLAAKNRKN